MAEITIYIHKKHLVEKKENEYLGQTFYTFLLSNITDYAVTISDSFISESRKYKNYYEFYCYSKTLTYEELLETHFHNIFASKHLNREQGKKYKRVSLSIKDLLGNYCFEDQLLDNVRFSLVKHTKWHDKGSWCSDAIDFGIIDGKMFYSHLDESVGAKQISRDNFIVIKEFDVKEKDAYLFMFEKFRVFKNLKLRIEQITSNLECLKKIISKENYDKSFKSCEYIDTLNSDNLLSYGILLGQTMKEIERYCKTLLTNEEYTIFLKYIGI